MDYKKLNQKELDKKIKEIKEDLSSLRFDIKAGDMANLNDYRNMKKELARALTALREGVVDTVKTDSKRRKSKKLKTNTK